MFLEETSMSGIDKMSKFKGAVESRMNQYDDENVSGTTISLFKI